MVTSAAFLLAVAAVLGFVEAVLMPPLPLPGVRLGLANIAVLLALGTVGEGPALAVSIGRVLIVGLAIGNLGGPATAFALSGAFAAWGAMCVVRRGGARFSAVGWSVAGSTAHVIAQMAVAAFITGVPSILHLLPVSLAASLLFGLATGIAANLLLSRTVFRSLTFG